MIFDWFTRLPSSHESYYGKRCSMKKILVIDDDILVRDTIVRILERKGYEVLVAGDGARGVRMFRSEQPDLVITDIIMPEKEALKRSARSVANVQTREALRSPAARALATWISWMSPANWARPKSCPNRLTPPTSSSLYRVVFRVESGACVGSICANLRCAR
jgi:hypothetical protein